MNLLEQLNLSKFHQNTYIHDYTTNYIQNNEQNETTLNNIAKFAIMDAELLILTNDTMTPELEQKLLDMTSTAYAATKLLMESNPIDANIYKLKINYCHEVLVNSTIVA